MAASMVNVKEKTQGICMGKQPPIRVALDLETTGLHAEQDAILEVAAIKFRGRDVLDKMETLIFPGRPIPYRVQRLTGITPEKIAGAPRFEVISRQLQEFIDSYPIVGHSIPFDVSFLRRRGLAQQNPLIDTFELASVLLPSLSSYNLGYVAQSLGLPVLPGRHRAMVDTQLAMDVFLALHARLAEVDLAILQDLARLDAPNSWPLLAFFRQELRERAARDAIYTGAARESGRSFCRSAWDGPARSLFCSGSPGRVYQSGGGCRCFRRASTSGCPFARAFVAGSIRK